MTTGPVGEVHDEPTAEVRRYRSDDLPGVIDLLADRFDGWRAHDDPAAFFRWKHEENPTGRSSMFVTEAADGRIVGFRSFMRWPLTTGTAGVQAVRGTDAAVHPDHQRRGLWTEMTRQDLAGMPMDLSLMFAHGNERSRAGYAKLGWPQVGRFPLRVQVLRPVRVGLAAARREGRSAARSPFSVDGPAALEPAGVLLADPGRLQPLFDELRAQESLRTCWTPEFLLWRFLAPPGLSYRGVVIEASHGPVGLLLGEHRRRGPLLEFRVACELVRPGDRHGRRALRRAAERAGADYVTRLFAGGPDDALSRRAPKEVSLPSAGTSLLAVGREEFRVPGPQGWALQLGDLESYF
jgi:ribosomal protein S18 acetylase RimI-like enzyme